VLYGTAKPDRFACNSTTIRPAGQYAESEVARMDKTAVRFTSTRSN
jgi:hypothetical protein